MLELFLECYCVARKKPIRCKVVKLQAVTVISFVAWREGGMNKMKMKRQIIDQNGGSNSTCTYTCRHNYIVT